MKFVFFGSPEFAAIILEKLIKTNMLLQAVVCNPDKPAGRKKIITSPPTKILAQKYNIPVLQPEILANCKSQIANYKSDFFIVAAYAKIIPKEIFDIPRLGTIGVHPSFLPKHRGPTPIQTAILNGDEETGTTLFLMDEKMDHGPILAVQELEIPNHKIQIPNKFQIPKSKITYEELTRKLAELSANLLIEILPKFIAGEIKPISQDESLATYTKKFKTEDAFIKAEDLETAQTKGGEIAVKIDRKIRALNPEPGTWTVQNEKRMKILKAKLTPEGNLKLKKIQFEGKKPQIIWSP